MKCQTLFGLMEAPINHSQYFIFFHSKLTITMKKIKKNLIIAFVLFVLIGLRSASAQTPITHTGDVFVVSQAEVDALSFTAGATRIVGNVTIGPALRTEMSDITNLSPLAAITEITGNVVVQRNPLLTNLVGLNQLQSIGGDFVVFSNLTLTSLGDFSTLQTIGRSFGVIVNGALTSLGDFPALQSIGGGFVVDENDALTSLGGFPMLTTIGSSDGVYVSSTRSDQDGVSIVVERNDRLQDCCVLTEFLSGASKTISGKVFINYNAPGCSSTAEVNCDPFLQVGQKVAFVAKTATEGVLEIFSRGRWQLSKPDTGVDWITDIAADGGNSGASSITGENDAFITITTTVNPSNAGRSTTLTLTVIDMAGNTLTDPAPITILFTQSGTTHTGDVSITTQSEVDALRTSLTAGATRIVGNVTIGSALKTGTSDITDLSPLAAITEITGNVVVRRNPDLANLTGLNQLQFIGGSFVVDDNDDLTSLGDFPTLHSIGDHFEVQGNDALISLGAFPLLANIGSSDEITIPSTRGNRDDVSILIEENDQLQDCCVLTAFLRDATNAVSGQVFIGDNALGCSSTAEVNCDPFLQVGQKVVFVAKTATEGTLEVFSTLRWKLSKPNTGAEWITNIAARGGNSNASSITGENDAFITITTTANPNDAGRSTTLTLTAMDMAGNALTDPAPITIPFSQSGTTHTEDVSVTTQAEVNALRTSLTAGATRIEGNVTIGPAKGTSDITDLSPLAAITEITGNVVVQRNPLLTNLMGLNQLQSFGGNFVVGKNFFGGGNNVLTSLGDFTALQSISGDFAVERNTELTSLGDFPALQSIGGTFLVNGNDNLLTSLGDFPALQTIGGNFEVTSNNDLTSLWDFSGLQSIGGGFEVGENTALTSLGDFTALQAIGDYFLVSHNTSSFLWETFPPYNPSVIFR